MEGAARLGRIRHAAALMNYRETAKVWFVRLYQFNADPPEKAVSAYTIDSKIWIIFEPYM